MESFTGKNLEVNGKPVKLFQDRFHLYKPNNKQVIALGTNRSFYKVCISK